MRSNLDRVDARLNTLHPALEELSRSGGDQPIPDALRQSLERTVVVPLRNMEDLIVSSQNTMRSLSNALLVLDSVPLFSLARSQRNADGERPLRSVATSLEETADLLHQILQSVTDIRPAQKLSSEQLSRPLTALTTARTRLDGVRGLASHVSLKLENAQASVAMCRERATDWLGYGSVAATLVCVCFGFTQISLLLKGVRLVSETR
jgi:hypothetical protein